MFDEKLDKIVELIDGKIGFKDLKEKNMRNKKYNSLNKKKNKSSKIKKRVMSKNKRSGYNIKSTHRFWTKYYIDSNGNYFEKPWWANFWRVGFLDDIPTRADYEREMDGKVYYEPYDEYGRLKERYSTDSHLYGLERLQMSINRLWNGSPREWIKLIFRIVLIITFFAAFITLGRTLFGVPLDAPLFSY